MKTRKFKDLTIRDAFMFAAVMSDSEICRRVLELALGIPISEVHIQTEKTMAYHSEYQGIRLDVYAADADRTRFNVEMQVTLQRFLPKRSRYYHDQIDMDALLAGDSYENLPDTYVIFICDFDPFGDGLYRYSTGMVCEEPGKSVSDGVKTIYLNAHGRLLAEQRGYSRRITAVSGLCKKYRANRRDFNDRSICQTSAGQY